MAQSHSQYPSPSQPIALAGINIFMYHRVVTEDTPFVLARHRDSGTTVSRSRFSAQIERLSERYQIISLAEAVDRLSCDKPLDRDYCVITFDDGYADNYHEAFPVLQQFGATATFFVMGGCIAGSGNGYVRWLDEYYYMLEHTRVSAALLRVAGTRMPRLIVPKGRGRRQLNDLVRRWPHDHKDALMSALRAALKVDVPGRAINSQLYLSVAQIREMHGAGMTIGAHTMTHPFEMGLMLRDAACNEIVRSLELVQSLTGEEQIPFAYPWGDPNSYNREIVNLLEDRAANCAVTTLTGTNVIGTPRFELRRIPVYEETVL